MSRRDKASTAASGLEEALLANFGAPRRVTGPFLLRPDDGLVFSSREHTQMVRGQGL